jgi:hypothetical protein
VPFSIPDPYLTGEQPELVAREIENLIAGKFQPLYQWLMANQTHHGM